MTTIKQNTQSVIMEVCRLKEENAAAYGYDIRKIAKAAQKRQFEHPDRMVTRIPIDQKSGQRQIYSTRPASETEL